MLLFVVEAAVVLVIEVLDTSTTLTFVLQG